VQFDAFEPKNGTLVAIFGASSDGVRPAGALP